MFAESKTLTGDQECLGFHTRQSGATKTAEIIGWVCPFSDHFHESGRKHSFHPLSINPSLLIDILE
jgi:hypothetical protein